MTPVELAVASLATYRLTRLAVRDEITRPWRERYVEPLLVLDGAPGRAAYLASCPWCLSVWVAAAVVLPRRGRLLDALAVAAAAGLLLDRDRS